MKFKHLFSLAALSLMASATFTSCEDILGHWEKPTSITPTPSEPEDKSGSGLLTGKFTINSSGDQVQFSQGNLQATTNDLGATWTWAFAEHQWDYIGGTTDASDASATTNNKINGNGTVSVNGTVDLFGWVGASNTTWTGAAIYGISNSTTTADYGTNATEALKSDWGTNMVPAGWRTLKSDEWTYLFSTRETGGTVFGTEKARYAHATINTDVDGGVNGIILFPDGVDIASSEVMTNGAVNNTSAYATKCTSAQWTALEAKGCVFLPAAGYRYTSGSLVYNAGSEGRYSSSSPSGSGADYTYYVYFYSGSLNLACSGLRYCGFSVRLVRPAE